MKEPKIEKGIPAPVRHQGRFTVLKKLKIGESVMLQEPSHTCRVAAQHHLGSGNYASRNENGGTRIWRIK